MYKKIIPAIMTFLFLTACNKKDTDNTPVKNVRVAYATVENGKASLNLWMKDNNERLYFQFQVPQNTSSLPEGNFNFSEHKIGVTFSRGFYYIPTKSYYETYDIVEGHITIQKIGSQYLFDFDVTCKTLGRMKGSFRGPALEDD